MDSLLGNWIVLAILAPAMWAMTCVADVCLVGSRCYRSVLDGAIVSGLFCFLPVLALLPHAVEPAGVAAAPGVAFAVLAGIGFAAYLYAYFSALFALNDASSAEVFSTLTVVVVPVFAWMLLGESLASQQYGGIALASIGAGILVCGYVGKVSPRAVVRLLSAIVLLSISMVLQARALELMGFVNAALVFFGVVTLVASAALLARAGHRRRLLWLCRRYLALFLVLEGLQHVAVASSQRATELSPSVSLVALFECLLPAFVVVFSAIALVVGRSTACLSRDSQDALSAQSTAMGVKGVSLGVISLGVVVAVS